MKKVLFVEFSIWNRLTPLVSGYLQAYAETDPELCREYSYEQYTTTVKAPAGTIIQDLIGAAADIYAFSCYVWNMRLIRSVHAALRHALPRAEIILGGPQVMRQAGSYLDRADERTVICNGEGEVTFARYLGALSAGTRNLELVDGLSFYRDGELITTPAQSRLGSLDEIPSPFLTGVFDARYSMSVIETNRGCPYHCGFCFWGAATNDRVYRFDQQRVCDEIEWMAKNDIRFLFIADANWGMLSRDVEISQHIADCSRTYGLPRELYFCSAKNKPHAVAKITGIFHEAGLLASHPVSMQTLEPQSLELISRSNIKLSAYSAIQKDLREKQINSYVELIWPLPGESLTSYRRGIGTLCENDAQTIITYSHLLLNNTPIYHNSEKYGMVTRPAGGDVGEARIVIATKEVPEADFAQGMRFFYAVHALHNTRSLRTVARHLVKNSGMRYEDVFAAFAEFVRGLPADDPITAYVERSIGEAGYYDLYNYGLFLHGILHEHRRLFSRHIGRFAESRDWYGNTVRALLEVDMINWPYVYSDTPLDLHENDFQAVRLLACDERSFVVQVPAAYIPQLTDAVRVQEVPVNGVFRVDHKRRQRPFMKAQSLDHNGAYCHGMIEKIENIMPVWRPA